MALEEILRRNRNFITRGGPAALGSLSGSPHWLVISCACPELTGTLDLALGLQPGEAAIIRLAGGWGGKDGEELLRSVTLALARHPAEAVLAVGHTGCACCRGSLDGAQRLVERAGLDKVHRHPPAWIAQLRGPASPEGAVRETVSLLRHSGLVPAGVPVHGLVLSLPDCGLRVVERDTHDREVKALPKRAAAAAAAAVPPPAPAGVDLPMPELPEIPMPELPLLDLDALSASPAPRPKKASVQYGGAPGTGPVSWMEIQKAAQVAMNAIPVPKFVVPPAPEIRGVDGQARPAAGGGSPPPVRRKKHKGRPDARSPAPQVPLGERVIELSEEVTPVPGEEISADLTTGLVRVADREHQLSEAMVGAIAKVCQFVSTEFSGGERQRLRDVMQAAKNAGTPPDELFKHLVDPVIKLGKKRYSIINELLQIKEEISKMESGVALAVLMGIIKA